MHILEGIATTEKRVFMAQLDNAVLDLLGVCREMLDYIRKVKTGRPRKNLILTTAQVALEQAEVEMDWIRRRQAAHISAYFGRMGYRYDFHLKVKEAQKREYGYYLTCIDSQGRTYIVKAERDSVECDIRPGLNLFLRGRIADRRIVNNRHVTYLEVLSGIQKVSPSESL